MTQIDEAARGYANQVDAYILDSIARGTVRFDQLLRELPGVDPSIALSRLRTLVSGRRVPAWVLGHAVRQIRCTPPPQSPRQHRILLPVPHPLDYDWRFSDIAIEHLLHLSVDLTRPEETTILLGMPALYREALERQCPRHIVLLDANQAAVKELARVVSPEDVRWCSVGADPLPEIKGALVIADPPWYPEPMRLFLSAACQLGEIGSHVLMSIPPVGTRPGIELEWTHLLQIAQQLGLELVLYERAQLPYVSPPFERNALWAAGLRSVPSDWRRADLALFIRRQDVGVLQRIRRDPKNEWSEVQVAHVRFRMQDQDDVGFADPSLVSLVPGDILPSVSRRDERRRWADVWTSGNRVFACRGRHVLAHILRAITLGGSLVDTVVAVLGRQLSDLEQVQVACAAEQVTRLIRVERSEYAYWGEDLAGC